MWAEKFFFFLDSIYYDYFINIAFPVSSIHQGPTIKVYMQVLFTCRHSLEG